MFLSGVASSRASKKKLTKLVTKKRKKFKKLEKKKLSSSGCQPPIHTRPLHALVLAGLVKLLNGPAAEGKRREQGNGEASKSLAHLAL